MQRATSWLRVPGGFCDVAATDVLRHISNWQNILMIAGALWLFFFFLAEEMHFTPVNVTYFVLQFIYYKKKGHLRYDKLNKILKIYLIYKFKPF